MHEQVENEVRGIIEELAAMPIVENMPMTPIITRARAVLDSMGPRMRRATSVKHHDDYLGVYQCAVAVGKDGMLHTSARVDCPPEYLLPLMAGARWKQHQQEQELGRQTRMSDKELESSIKSICDGIAAEDFQARWDIVRENLPEEVGGSRTKGAGKIIVPKG